MLSENNSENLMPAVNQNQQPIGIPQSEEEFTQSQEKALLERCNRLLKGFKERYQQEDDDSMDIIHKP